MLKDLTDRFTRLVLEEFTPAVKLPKEIIKAGNDQDADDRADEHAAGARASYGAIPDRPQQLGAIPNLHQQMCVIPDRPQLLGAIPDRPQQFNAISINWMQS